MAEGKSSKLANKITDYLFSVALYAEVLLASLLLVLVIFGIGFFISRIVASVSQHVVLSPTIIRNELDIVLVIFIIIELFRIAVAYYQKKQVLSTVIEAAFVAIARKVVLFDFAIEGLNGAISLSLLMISIGISYFLIRYISKNVSDL
jgi:uncharacterized membrane protein (DUF373 family)